MHHDHEPPDLGPARKQDRYPATVWPWYRTSGMPAVLLLGTAAALLGLLLDLSWLMKSGVLAGGAAMVLAIPALVLEYRADMRHDRERPAEEVQA